MGRRKQSRPHRSGQILQNRKEEILDDHNSSEGLEVNNKEVGDSGKQFFVQIDQNCWTLDEHFDIAEVFLKDLTFQEELPGCKQLYNCYQDSELFLRFRLQNIEELLSRIRLGNWPVMSVDNISLEFVKTCKLEDKDSNSVLLYGFLDGPDEGVSSLVHLVSQRILTLRPVPEFSNPEGILSVRLRVEILKGAFDFCESLLETSRQPWKRSMLSVMAWLRPEVMTEEARYGKHKSEDKELDSHIDTGINKKSATFDAAGFYEAIKPSKAEPMLDDELPDLLPKLRPYQRRAAYWMVKRERGPSSLGEKDEIQFFRPLCVPVNFIDSCSRMFYNPFSGSISSRPISSSTYVSGGILADEMGLGKTVELLVCIFAHRKSPSEGITFYDHEMQIPRDKTSKLKRLKRERIECICGAVSESPKYNGIWVQCDICDAWQHAVCVGFSPAGKTDDSLIASRRGGHGRKPSMNLDKHLKKKNLTNIVEVDGNHICQLCSELMQVTDSPVFTGATLIVCPAPILPQWHSEIIRHTKPGSLKTCVYEGVRNASLSNTSIMSLSELVSADIVLTTYDVLKEDLSHDSDRHEGDRRFMRFQKRYPVIPTLLTGVFWWRICLDEAQMVESNAAAATEMAMRLHTKHRWCITGTPIQRRLDDLYGLLRFLCASPFNEHRWWTKVIRDPYERGEIGAMEFAHKFFKQIMWRSSKAHVADELQLPPQEEHLSWLFFSPIEAHFYQRQHETCVGCAYEVIESFKADILKRNVRDFESSDPFLTHLEAAKLLNSLLKLRQACCHPQVGSSGLRSLQQSPMTMQEILDVLVAKTKLEGEEALRKLVFALNGLAGIAVIEQELSQAISLYKEALALAEEHYDDFRLDPLLNLHIHHNLAEILPDNKGHSQPCMSTSGQFSENEQENSINLDAVSGFDGYSVKRQKTSSDNSFTCGSLEHQNKLHDFTSDMSTTGVSLGKDAEHETESHLSSRSSGDGCLRTVCENIKQKYLSVFISRLSLAQQEFRKSYIQVCDAFSDRKNLNANWWLETLQHVEQSRDASDELIKKIGEAVSSKFTSSKSSRISSRFRSISGLKYIIQTSLDSLETSRKKLIDRLLEIDQTMEKPRDGDIESVRACSNCQANGDGPICISCELDELFQAYGARLFYLRKGHDGGIISSAEEAVDLQKKRSELNHFYWSLSDPNKGLIDGTEEDKRKRDVETKIVVSRTPPELEVVLGVIKSCSKSQLGREGTLAATKQLFLFEVMRKEYAQARYLATAQAQVLRAHDEIKMATSRLRLRETDNDTSAIDALSSEELIASSVQWTSEKFASLSLLSRIKGQLRYLKGLVLSKQEKQSKTIGISSLPQDSTTFSVAFHTAEQSGCLDKPDDETCPVCQEKLKNQKMVFQCGHVICCKCLVAMTEQRLVHQGKSQDKWVICPTCRQRTEFGNIAFVDDERNQVSDFGSLDAFQGHERPETSINVQGSYGTKIEAVTRRILWIKATDPKAKSLVFSSWNDVLDVLEHALVANNIGYIRMKGGRKSQVAISKFKEQENSAKENGKMHKRQPEKEPVQVLLLLIQHGANGLNLLEAQHVILIEPLLNPAAEAQAISRVHRVGQEKMTLVHRFIVKDTVEESIYKMNRSRSAHSIISGNMKNQDQAVLTLKDVESLFCTAIPSTAPETDRKPTESLMHLPPHMAAAIAAERRLKESMR